MSSPLVLAIQLYAESLPPAAPVLRAVRSVDLDVTVSPESDHNFFTDVSGDIRRGGLFVATSQLAPCGTRLGLRFTLEPGGGPYEAAAEVSWVRDGRFSSLPPGMGLRFLSLPGQAQLAITRFVRQRDTILYEE
jgi:uncharacterized protein (TIGR02266 family)